MKVEAECINFGEVSVLKHLTWAVEVCWPREATDNTCNDKPDKGNNFLHLEAIGDIHNGLPVDAGTEELGGDEGEYSERNGEDGLRPEDGLGLPLFEFL